MKSFYTLLLLCALMVTQSFAQENRYLAEVFTDVEVQEGVVYGNNVTVLTVSDPNIAKPVPRDLVVNIYSPAGDTEAERPLVLYFPTGNFLPNPINGGTTGTMKDSVAVDIAERLAKMGYVVAIVDYRKGWNPISDDPLERRSTLINAAYRGIQDSRTAVRFFKKSVAEEGNPYGICANRITLWGQGTGGYITLGSNAIDSYNELLLPKFFGEDINGDGNPDPMVIEPIHGNPDGTLNTTNPANGEPLSISNHEAYDSEFQLTVNMGGALGDISWLTENDGPLIAYHVPRDPFAPYGTAELIVPTTGEFVVEVSGSYDVMQKAAEFGLNESFASANIDDEFTAAANARNDGAAGLFPMPRPTGVNPLTGQPALEGSPWDLWEPAVWTQVPHPSCPEGVPLENCNFHIIGLINNNDMSPEKSMMYVDSILGYFAPRAFATLELEAMCGADPNSVEEVLDANSVQLTAVPNPATDFIMLESAADRPMQDVEVYDLSGRLVQHLPGIERSQARIVRNDLATGIYIAKVRFAEGVVTQKVIFE